MMTTNRRVAHAALLGCLSANLLGCSGDTQGEAPHAQKAQALTLDDGAAGEQEFLYLLCNATDWGLSDASRLSPSSDPDTFSLSYEVSQSWMVGEGSDNCSLVVTNQLNGWGTQSAQFGLQAGLAPLVVPDSAPLTPWSGISLSYPQVGGYTASVNWSSRTISVTPQETDPTPEEAAAQRAEDFYTYLLERFNWAGVDNAGTKPPIGIDRGLPNNAQWLGTFLAIGTADGVVTNSFAYSGDMVAHELTHAINSNTAKMNPGGEVGAVNESMADVMAVFATAEAGVVDWRLAEEVWTPQIAGDSLRNLETYPLRKEAFFPAELKVATPST